MHTLVASPSPAAPVISVALAMFSDLSYAPFLPPDPSRPGRYVLGKVVGNHVNLTTFDWHPVQHQWESVCGRTHYRFMPPELGGRGFEVMDEIGLSDTPVWDCRDVFGARLDAG